MSDDAARFLRIITIFNEVLREGCLRRGMGFLDVFAMTDAGGGKASGDWHIDVYHLRPDALTKAFAEYVRRAR
jgi:hypothetical protein